MAHYIHDEKNNRIEGMSKEEIYALLADAIQTGQLPSVDEDTAFVTMFKSIVDGKTYKMAFCTQAQYNQLEAQGLLVADAYYIITDDTTYDDLLAYINTQVATLNNDKLNKNSHFDYSTATITNEDGTLSILSQDIDAEETLQLKFENAHAILIFTPNVGTSETFNLVNLLRTINNSTISATASTTTTNCTFNIVATTKNVIARAGAIVLVEYDITAYLDYDSGFSSSGTAIGTINLTIPTGFRPSIAIPLNISAAITGDMTATSAVASNLNTNGTMSITCRGNYNGFVNNAEYKIRLYGTYTTL